MADLLADLAKKPQRETAGADSAARFDYQKDWAFCRMMRKHIEGESYVIAFEFHDDVLFLTPAVSPSSAEFAQVKTSAASKPRTLSSITTHPPGKASILGKMLSNFDGICASHDVRVTLVSNNAFEFADDIVCADDLDEKFRDRLLKKIKTEIPSFDEDRLKKLHFRVSGVSLDAMQSFLEGEALELFSNEFGEDHSLNIRTWVRLMKTEIARRNNFDSEQIHTVDDLLRKKCVDRALVSKTLAVMNAKSAPLPDIATISAHLTSCGWAFSDVMRMQKNIPGASNDFYNPLNGEVKVIASRMRDHISAEEGPPPALPLYLDVCVDEIMSGDFASVYKNTDYLRALGVIVYYDAI